MGAVYHRSRPNDLGVTMKRFRSRICATLCLLLLLGCQPAGGPSAKSETEALASAKKCLDRGDYDQAITEFDEVIRRNPEIAVAYNNRGLAHYKKGELDNAITDYNAAIRLNPALAAAY